MPQNFEWNCNEMKTTFVLGKTFHHYNVAANAENWLKGSGSAFLCLRPLVLITGKNNWGDGDELDSGNLN